jgi:hypothetical protein
MRPSALTRAIALMTYLVALLWKVSIGSSEQLYHIKFKYFFKKHYIF